MPESITKEQAWERFASRVSEVPKEKEAKVVKMSWWIPLSIAASITFMAVAFFVFGTTEIATHLAETRVHILPDGSEVTLNADSKIAFRKIGWSGNRVVTLEGEAFFNVKKGTSFTVESEKGTVTVLGTSFNVNTRNSGFEVACYTGKVNVESNDQSVMLTKGLTTKLENGQLTGANEFDDQRKTWRDGEFYFEAQSLSVVFGELARQFDLEIVFMGDSSRLSDQYSGNFSNHDETEALELVLKPMGLTYRRENNKIIIQ